MSELGYWVAIITLIVMNVAVFIQMRQLLESSEKRNADLTDRLMAKVPEQYFGIRMEEEQNRVDAVKPAPEEVVDPLMYNVGPRP